MFSSCSFASESHFSLGHIRFKCPHKKEYCPGTGRKRDETVKSDYESHSSGLEGRPGDVVYQDDGSSIPVAEAVTINEQEEESVSNRVLSFLIESADILQRLVKQGESRNASQLIGLLADTFSEMNIFKPHAKSIADCKDMRSRNTKEIVKDDVLCRVMMSGSNVKKDGPGTLYVNDLTEELRKQAECCGRDEIILRPERGNALLRAVIPCMTMKLI